MSCKNENTELTKCVASSSMNVLMTCKRNFDPLSDRKIGLFMDKQSIRALFLKFPQESTYRHLQSGDVLACKKLEHSNFLRGVWSGKGMATSPEEAVWQPVAPLTGWLSSDADAVRLQRSFRQVPSARSGGAAPRACAAPGAEHTGACAHKRREAPPPAPAGGGRPRVPGAGSRRRHGRRRGGGGRREPPALLRGGAAAGAGERGTALAARGTAAALRE